FKASRGWRFRMVSYGKGTFAADMGYRGPDGHHPGVSVFRKRGGKMFRVSDTSFSPGDDFCTIWHFFDLIPEGSSGWAPKYKYWRGPYPPPGRGGGGAREAGRGGALRFEEPPPGSPGFARGATLPLRGRDEGVIPTILLLRHNAPPALAVQSRRRI